MLELFHHQSRSSTLPSWPGSTTKLNTLPPLYSSSAAGFAAPYAPPTPPEMNGMSVHGGLHPRGPVARPGGSSDASFSKYAHASQPRPRQQSSYSPASSSATSAIYNSRPLTEQADRKDYSAPAESPISPDLRIPPKVDTPQHSMPQLAAEVRSQTHCSLSRSSVLTFYRSRASSGSRTAPTSRTSPNRLPRRPHLYLSFRTRSRRRVSGNGWLRCSPRRR